MKQLKSTKCSLSANAKSELLSDRGVAGIPQISKMEGFGVIKNSVELDVSGNAGYAFSDLQKNKLSVKISLVSC